MADLKRHSGIPLVVLALVALAQANVAVATRTIAEKQPRCTVKIEYPEVAGQPAINKLLAASARKQADEFWADFKKYGKEDPKEAPPWDLTGGFEKVYETPAMVVFLQSSYLYTGGAHGSPLNEPFIFDLKTGKRLGLPDFYRDGYLKVLSQESRVQLKANPDLKEIGQTIDEGTTPVASNFTVVFPTEKGMRIVFPAYQVAPYAAGQPEVLVPYSKLAAFARPGTPLEP